MNARARAIRVVSVAVLVIGLAATVQPAHGQGKRGGDTPAKSGAVPPGKVKKLTPTQAVSITREILIARGYRVVRIEAVKGSQVIYYRRGNNGRGRGLGPVQTMIVRPSGDIVVFESAPEQVRIDLKVRLGF